MPNSTSLVPYSVRIREKRSEDFFSLNDVPLPDFDNDFITVMEAYLDARLEEGSVDDERQSSIEVDGYESAQRRMFGTFKSGSYGYEAELKNIETGEIKTRDPDDCELIPFYFRLEHRRGQDSALLLLQRFGLYGVKSNFQNDISAFIREHNEDLIVSINPIVSDNEIDRLIGRGLKKIRYIRHTVPADAADDLNIRDNQIEQCEMETVIKAKRDRFLAIPAWIRDLANNRAPAENIIEVNGHEYDDVKIVISDSGRLRTLKMSDVRSFRMSIDVSADVDFDETGHPTTDSIDRAARELMPELRTAVGWNDVQ